MTHYHYVPPNNWTTERVALLDRLISRGFSAGQIAEELGGITRSAVIGKARRLGIGFCATNPSGRPKSGRKPRKHPFVERKPPSRRPWAIPRPEITPGSPATEPDVITELPLEPVANPVTLLELTEFTCRWPVAGEPVNMLFCGAIPAPGAPYCAGHCGVAFQQQRNTTEAERHMLRLRAMRRNGLRGALTAIEPLQSQPNQNRQEDTRNGDASV